MLSFRQMNFLLAVIEITDVSTVNSNDKSLENDTVQSVSPGIFPDVIQLADHMGHVCPHHLESYLVLAHDLEPVRQRAC